MREVAGDGWRLQVPEGLIAKPHKAWAYIAVCAKARKHAVGLTIRSRREDGISAALEPIVASLELVP